MFDLSNKRRSNLGQLMAANNMTRNVFGLSEEDALEFADFNFVKLNDAFFTIEPAFGNAGGPDRVRLSTSGITKALEFACQSRWDLSAIHYKALSMVKASDGLIARSVDRFVDELLRDLSHLALRDRSQESIAAGLRGDEAEYQAIRNANRLVYLDQTNHGTQSKWRLTELGLALISFVSCIEDAMICKRTEFKDDNACSTAVA